MTLAVLEDVPLAQRTTLELGGRARFFVEAHVERDIEDALEFARARGVGAWALGGGSNVVVPDAGVEGIVVAIMTRGVSMRRDGDDVLVDAAAGEPWDALVGRTVEAGLSGLECLSGIPGLVGATPIQNVGAYGQDVSETIESVRLYDRRARRVLSLGRAELGFAYRDSVLKRDPERAVVLEVRYRLRRDGAPKVAYAELERALSGETPPTLARTREAVLALRRRKSMVYDPVDPNRRSAGSFFTNPIVEARVAQEVVLRAAARARAAGGVATDVPRWPEPDGRVKLAAGWLIEQAGVQKGLRTGQVGVSSAHALALVHHGGGTASELLAFADDIAGRVREAWGVDLEREPVLLGATGR